jgi:hypothetical protein
MTSSYLRRAERPIILTFKYFAVLYKSQLRTIPDLDPGPARISLGFKQLAYPLHAGEAGHLRVAALLAAGPVIRIRLKTVWPNQFGSSRATDQGELP